MPKALTDKQILGTLQVCLSHLAKESTNDAVIFSHKHLGKLALALKVETVKHDFLKLLSNQMNERGQFDYLGLINNENYWAVEKSNESPWQPSVTDSVTASYLCLAYMLVKIQAYATDSSYRDQISNIELLLFPFESNTDSKDASDINYLIRAVDQLMATIDIATLATAPDPTPSAIQLSASPVADVKQVSAQNLDQLKNELEKLDQQALEHINDKLDALLSSIPPAQLSKIIDDNEFTNIALSWLKKLWLEHKAKETHSAVVLINTEVFNIVSQLIPTVMLENSHNEFVLNWLIRQWNRIDEKLNQRSPQFVWLCLRQPNFIIRVTNLNSALQNVTAVEFIKLINECSDAAAKAKLIAAIPAYLQAWMETAEVDENIALGNLVKIYIEHSVTQSNENKVKADAKALFDALEANNKFKAHAEISHQLTAVYQHPVWLHAAVTRKITQAPVNQNQAQVSPAPANVIGLNVRCAVIKLATDDAKVVSEQFNLALGQVYRSNDLSLDDKALVGKAFTPNSISEAAPEQTLAPAKTTVVQQFNKFCKKDAEENKPWTWWQYGLSALGGLGALYGLYRLGKYIANAFNNDPTPQTVFPKAYSAQPTKTNRPLSTTSSVRVESKDKSADAALTSARNAVVVKSVDPLNLLAGKNTSGVKTSYNITGANLVPSDPDHPEVNGTKESPFPSRPPV